MLTLCPMQSHGSLLLRPLAERGKPNLLPPVAPLELLYLLSPPRNLFTRARRHSDVPCWEQG
eukprot:scaffold224401_cov15-Tisochrysis_lutea.AAC.1